MSDNKHWGDFQVYKSRWTLMKCLYLVCRFCPLLFWPAIMYALLWDHDMDRCKPMLVINAVIFLLFVCPSLNLEKLNWYLSLTGYHTPVHIYSPCICVHGCNERVTRHMFVFLLRIPFHCILVFFREIGGVWGGIFGARTNGLLSQFPS